MPISHHSWWWTDGIGLGFHLELSCHKWRTEWLSVFWLEIQSAAHKDIAHTHTHSPVRTRDHFGIVNGILILALIIHKTRRQMAKIDACCFCLHISGTYSLCRVSFVAVVVVAVSCAGGPQRIEEKEKILLSFFLFFFFLLSNYLAQW